MKILKSNQFKHTDNVSAGFTLIELLVSISIMGIVFTLVGTGITFMVSSDQKLAAAQSRRVDISRALDVMSYDIRKAENVNGRQNSSPAATVADAIGTPSPLDSSYTPVLSLNISIICSDNTVVPERVIYSTKAKTAGWVGPNILYRYGRIADKDDKIPCSQTPVNVPISDNIIVAPTPPTCVYPTDTITPAASEGADGFYTCVSDNQVSISLFAALKDSLVYGDNRTITSGAVTSTATVLGGSATASTAADIDCTVPNLLTLEPSNAEDIILARPSALPPASPSDPLYTGLSASGIAIGGGSGGSTVISQTPSAGSKIPCKRGLVTYTY